MLILSRRVGEMVMIGNDVICTVLGVKGSQVRWASTRNVAVHREEIYGRIEQEQAGSLHGAATEQAAPLSADRPR